MYFIAKLIINARNGYQTIFIVSYAMHPLEPESWNSVEIDKAEHQ